VGKSFLIDCFASECGLPVMELGDFRSKWVGDTERQQTRILATVRALGPVIVVVDEADAVFGNRSESGDSGVAAGSLRRSLRTLVTAACAVANFGSP
jgi:SpoVK/Ycf46/Vps4 family AAA+-type ATPase